MKKNKITITGTVKQINALLKNELRYFDYSKSSFDQSYEIDLEEAVQGKPA